MPRWSNWKTPRWRSTTETEARPRAGLFFGLERPRSCSILRHLPVPASGSLDARRPSACMATRQPGRLAVGLARELLVRGQTAFGPWRRQDERTEPMFWDRSNRLGAAVAGTIAGGRLAFFAQPLRRRRRRFGSASTGAGKARPLPSRSPSTRDTSRLRASTSPSIRRPARASRSRGSPPAPTMSASAT